MMVSQSNSRVTALCCFMGLLVAASGTQASTHSSLPKRYRTAQDVRKQQQQHQQQQGKVVHRTTTSTEAEMRMLQFDVLPVETSMSMSIPTVEFDFSMMLMLSIPMTELDYSMSLPMMEYPNEETLGTDTTANNGDDNGRMDRKTVMLSTFLAGVSFSVIAAMAMFVKMRRSVQHHARQVDEIHPRSEQNMVQSGSFATFDDANDPEEGLSMPHEVRIY